MTPMPYEIVYHPGPGTNTTAFKRYPSGAEARATADEVAVWGHVLDLRAALDEARAAPPGPAAGGKKRAAS